MYTLRSWICGEWVSGSEPFRTLHNATTGEPLARCSARGVDRQAALAYARTVGGPTLRAMTFVQRAEMLKAMAGVIHSHRDELIGVQISRRARPCKRACIVRTTDVQRLGIVF